MNFHQPFNMTVKHEIWVSFPLDLGKHWENVNRKMFFPVHTFNIQGWFYCHHLCRSDHNLLLMAWLCRDYRRNEVCFEWPLMHFYCVSVYNWNGISARERSLKTFRFPSNPLWAFIQHSTTFLFLTYHFPLIFH